MLRRLNLLDALGSVINPARADIQTNGQQKTQLVDEAGESVYFVQTESGHAIPVYLTGRADSGMISLSLSNLSVGTYRFVLIDISDTNNYNHTDVGYAHIDTLQAFCLCDVNGTWELNLGFIEDVTASGSKEIIWWSRSGAKDVGNKLDYSIVLHPAGPHLVSSKFTYKPVASSSGFNSATMVPSTLSPSIPDVYPGNGDVVATVNVTAGNIKNLSLSIAYHSHY